jgi:hypothetical protein
MHEAHDGPARVVPSPARRMEPGWVFEPLPLRPRDGTV